ncbi:sarcosine oxidase subunit gamma [Halopolyspora algeriensis]|uniref:Sarcosine oxidase subunit gamma n=1 Tax=Halopolyspora algeriensis TaxID=1500506 RepID=A0A368VUK0_9ACTN|nr:sarcosine oxidase subunit gamma family protein [Halopolyspora algeriensis]RCW43133.1 sarcosine oxidase subunit gamma [Halopolyspora algeriensis]TQM56191.1 sarcosine oxidase subunit gamma [Halopolyspora algeriensis]
MTVVSTNESSTEVAGLRRSPLAGRRDELAAAGVEGLRGVRLGEEPFLSQVNLRVLPASPAAAGVEQALGTILPREPNRVTGDEHDAALWLGPDEWLVVAPDGRADGIVEAARTAMADSPGSVVDVSANRTTLRLAGPTSREVLEKVCSLDLHPRAFRSGQCAQTLVGRAQVVLWQVGTEPAYRLMVRGSFADYLADLLLDAMAEFTHR